MALQCVGYKGEFVSKLCCLPGNDIHILVYWKLYMFVSLIEQNQIENVAEPELTKSKLDKFDKR